MEFDRRSSLLRTNVIASAKHRSSDHGRSASPDDDIRESIRVIREAILECLSRLDTRNTIFRIDFNVIAWTLHANESPSWLAADARAILDHAATLIIAIIAAARESPFRESNVSPSRFTGAKTKLIPKLRFSLVPRSASRESMIFVRRRALYAAVESVRFVVRHSNTFVPDDKSTDSSK